jgi:hypothetical protein
MRLPRRSVCLRMGISQSGQLRGAHRRVQKWLAPWGMPDSRVSQQHRGCVSKVASCRQTVVHRQSPSEIWGTGNMTQHLVRMVVFNSDVVSTTTGESSPTSAMLSLYHLSR